MTVKNYNFRIYPKEKHQRKLFKSFDICTETWNIMLEARTNAWKNDKISLKDGDTRKMISTKHLDFQQLNIINHVLQNQSKRLNDSFNNFFRRCKNHEKIKGYPKFKKRTYSITYPDSLAKKSRNGYEILGNRLWVSKIGLIPIKISRKIDGTIKNLTIKRLRCGEWYAIFSVEKKSNEIEKIDLSKPVGIDLGLNSFAFLSDGTNYLHPKHLQKSEKRLKFFQRRLSRKVKGSNNRRKARFKLSIFHQYIKNQRKDYLHKVSTEISKKYTFVALETLNINGMMKNHHLAKSIGSSGWSDFQKMLDYKCKTVYLKPFTPSSSICSNCGMKTKMELSDRIFNCSCGLKLDRDFNASKVILQSVLSQNNYSYLNDTVGYTEIQTTGEFSPLRSLALKNASKDAEPVIKKDKKLSSSDKNVKKHK